MGNWHIRNLLTGPSLALVLVLALCILGIVGLSLTFSGHVVV